MAVVGDGVNASAERGKRGNPRFVDQLLKWKGHGIGGWLHNTELHTGCC